MAKPNLQKLAERFDALVVRERLLLAAAFFAAIYILFDLLILGPTQKKINMAEANITSQKKQLDALKAEETILAKVLSNDPNMRLKKELEELTAHLTQLDQDILQISTGLVSGDQLALMLQDVLKLSHQLQIESLNTSAPEKINLNPNSPKVNVPKEKGANDSAIVTPPPASDIPEIRLYRQGVKLVVNGSYFQILDYVKKLEATGWRFYWEGLHYQVMQYPQAMVELNVYTLSVQMGANNG